jgi:hypothetical protein
MEICQYVAMGYFLERSPIHPVNSSQSSDYNTQLYFGLIFNPEFYKPFRIGPNLNLNTPYLEKTESLI